MILLKAYLKSAGVERREEEVETAAASTGVAVDTTTITATSVDTAPTISTDTTSFPPVQDNDTVVDSPDSVFGTDTQKQLLGPQPVKSAVPATRALGRPAGSGGRIEACDNKANRAAGPNAAATNVTALETAVRRQAPDINNVRVGDHANGQPERDRKDTRRSRGIVESKILASPQVAMDMDAELAATESEMASVIQNLLEKRRNKKKIVQEPEEVRTTIATELL
jgi:hypothetical protein